MLSVLTLDHMENVFLCSVFFKYSMTMEGWTSSLFLVGPKSGLKAPMFVQIRCTHLRWKLQRKLVEPRVLKKMVCLVADIFALVSNFYCK